MKTMKKLTALVVALVMALAMTVTAFAEDATYKLTITGTTTGHTYAVYQIFTGDISGTAPNYVLSNLKYGSNYGTAGETVPQTEIDKITDADTFAQSVVVKGTPVKTVTSVAGDTVIEGLVPGYYLVKETTEKMPEGEAYTKTLLQVVGDTSIAVKSSVPSMEKKVRENVKTVTGDEDTRVPGFKVGGSYNDVADYNIGDAVPFEIIGTMPANLADYDTYKYIFHDTLSTGLTAPATTDVKVYLCNGNTVSEDNDITNKFDVTVNGQELTIACDNVKAIEGVAAGSKIVVRYSATLNSSAVIGLDGNENSAYLEFSNNPNKGGDGDTEDTPEDKVVVFTYELDTTKVDGEDGETPLKDAEFKLRNEAGKWAIVTDGKVSGWADTEANGTTLVSGENGLFVVTGLDDGKYYLKETKAPTGYNLLANEIELTVIATTANNQTWDETASTALTELQITAAGETTDGDVDTGIVDLTVENNKGATLPTTGGMGTTVIYIVGAILVLGAGVLLITRRRLAK